MRLTSQQMQQITDIVHNVLGEKVLTYVFGSRLDDNARGGDLDLMLDLAEPIQNPALLSAKLSANISKIMHGRKVDILLKAPNLAHLPIHDIVFSEGQRL